MKIYVGNLPYQLSEEELAGVFAPYGQVISASIITDRETGRSKGFGFVEVEGDDAGKAAIEGLNGYDLKGRKLKVDNAKPRRDSRGGGGRYSRDQY